MLKRLYHLLALLALVNLFALTGFAAYLFVSGRLDGERMKQIAMVLRGEFPAEPEVKAELPATQPAAPVERSEAELARVAAKKEYYQLVSDFHRTELDRRKALDERVQLETLQLLERIEATEKALETKREEQFDAGQQAGFERQLTILSNIEPTKAKDMLRNPGAFKEADVVRLLMAMDENRVKAIVNSCKTAEELDWIGRILNQIGQYGSASVNGVDGPVAASAKAG